MQTAEDDSKSTPDWEKEVKPEFRMNVGKSGQIFNEDSQTGHRFFALAKETPGWEKRFELSKLEAGYNRVKTPKGNTVKVSIYADDVDLEKNLEVAVKHADNGIDTSIEAHINPNIIQDRSNPEYKINGKIADLKANFKKDNYNGISNLFKSAKSQGCESIAIDFTDSFKNLEVNRIFQILNGKITQTRGKWVSELVLSYHDNVVLITRKQILDGELGSLLKKLKADK